MRRSNFTSDEQTAASIGASLGASLGGKLGPFGAGIGGGLGAATGYIAGSLTPDCGRRLLPDGGRTAGGTEATDRREPGVAIPVCEE